MASTSERLRTTRKNVFIDTKNRGCSLIRACSLIRSNTVCIREYTFFSEVKLGLRQRVSMYAVHYYNLFHFAEEYCNY